MIKSLCKITWRENVNAKSSKWHGSLWKLAEKRSRKCRDLVQPDLVEGNSKYSKLEKKVQNYIFTTSPNREI